MRKITIEIPETTKAAVLCYVYYKDDSYESDEMSLGTECFGTERLREMSDNEDQDR